MPLNYLYNVVYGSVWWDLSAVVTSCVTTWVLVITPVEHAAAEVLRKHGGAMRVSVFYNELYRACPEAKEEVTAKGGPKKWASSSCVHTTSVSGQMISIAPTPPQPKKRQPVIHKVVLYKPQSSVKLGITLTSSNDGAVRITGINAGGIAATVPLLQVDQYVIAINGEEVRDHSSATSLLQAAVGNVNLKVTHSRPLTATGMPSKSGRSDNSEPRGGKGTGLCPSFQSTGCLLQVWYQMQVQTRRAHRTC